MPASDSLPHELHIALSDAVLAITAEHDLDDVLQIIADKARELLDVAYSAVGVPDRTGARLERFVTSGLTPEVIEAIRGTPQGHGLLGVTLREGVALNVPDVGADSRATGVPQHHPPMGPMLSVPILRVDDVLGQIYVASEQGGQTFSGSDEALLDALARHAALAITGARLVSELSDSAERYRLLTQGAPEIVFALDDDGRITFVNERTRVVTGFEPEVLLGRRLRDLVLPEDRPVVDYHVGQLGSGAPHVTFDAGSVGRDRAVRHFEISLVPRRVAGTGYQGIAIDVTDRRAKAREAVERTAERLSSGGESEELREFVAMVIQAQEDERARIAGDLHDTVVQTLTAIGRRLRRLASEVAENPDEAGAELAELAAAAMDEADEMRRLSRNLRPSVLDHLGLDAALHHLAEELRSTGAAVDVHIDGDARALDDRERTTLFRIAQEALTNVRRHGEAQTVSVHLSVTETEATLEVADDGVGFAIDVAPPRPQLRSERLGLVGMKERAALLGGTFSIRSEPGSGTRVAVALPIGSVQTPAGRSD